MSVLKEVIYYILSSEFRFKDQFDPQTDAELYDTDDILLNYTLKKLCCEIIFNL